MIALLTVPTIPPDAPNYRRRNRDRRASFRRQLLALTIMALLMVLCVYSYVQGYGLPLLAVPVWEARP